MADSSGLGKTPAEVAGPLCRTVCLFTSHLTLQYQIIQLDDRDILHVREPLSVGCTPQCSGWEANSGPFHREFRHRPHMPPFHAICKKPLSTNRIKTCQWNNIFVFVEFQHTRNTIEYYKLVLNIQCVTYCATSSGILWLETTVL